MTRSAGQRHEWNSRLCEQLQKIAWGRQATAILATPIPRQNHAVVALPTWAWAEPKANLGRKARASDGGLLLFPIQVTWSVAPLLLLQNGQSVTAAWTAVGAGHSEAGETVITASSSTESPPGTPPGAIAPATVDARTLPRPRFMSLLHEYAAQGRNAYWEALSDLEGHLSWAFQRAHSAVSAELYPDQCRPVLDPITQESLQTKLLVGEDGDTACVVSRLIDRCLTPGKFRSVDPERYVVTALVSASETAIRRRIADPHIGRKVRRFAAQSDTPFDSIDDLVDAYANAYPRDHLSTRRATAALTATHRSPQVVSLSDQVERHLTDATDGGR